MFEFIARQHISSDHGVKLGDRLRFYDGDKEIRRDWQVIAFLPYEMCVIERLHDRFQKKVSVYHAARYLKADCHRNRRHEQIWDDRLHEFRAKRDAGRFPETGYSQPDWHYYVSVLKPVGDSFRHELLLGPYATHNLARSAVRLGKYLVMMHVTASYDSFSYQYGTCKIVTTDPPIGLFSDERFKNEEFDGLRSRHSRFFRRHESLAT
jgi:hypothetical protein